MAILGQSSLGTMRLNAARLNYHNQVAYITIGGIRREDSVRRETIQIQEYNNSTPNRATMRVWGFTPKTWQDVKIYTGAPAASDLRFGGTILSATQVYEGVESNIAYDLSVIDYSFILDSALVYGTWTNVSATTVAKAIISNFTTGYTSNTVQANLPAVTITFDGLAPTNALTRLAQLVGARWKIDYTKDLRFQTTSVAGLPDPDTVTDANTFKDSVLALLTDATQRRTRVTVIGAGTKAPTPVAAGETIVPLDSGALFPSAGSAYVPNSGQRIAYSGVQAGGGGSLVGPGAAPSSAPTLTLQPGAGVNPGAHAYAYTEITAGGETLPSPLASVTTGVLAAPSSAPAAAVVAGSGLSEGAYQYETTFSNSAGETTPGPTVSATTGSITDPANAPTVAPINTGNFWPGGTQGFVAAYVFTNGALTTGLSPGTSFTLHNGDIWTQQMSGSVPNNPFISGVTVYSSSDGGSTWFNVAGGIVAPGGAFSFQYFPGTGTGSSAATNNATFHKVTLGSIPLGPTSTTARTLYRTTVGGTQLKFLATIADNATTTYTDTTADGSLGANAPTSNTAAVQQVALSGVAIGPTSPVAVTSRKLYRTVAGGSQLKLLATIADNTTTTYTDSTADASLGANAPTSDTSGLSQPTGQVLAGSSTLLLAGAGAFSASGGWARIGSSQIVRYTGISGNTLTGIPASGIRAIGAPVGYNTTVTAVPALLSITVDGGSGLTTALNQGDDVRLRVQRDDTTAQAALAAAIGSGTGIIEDKIDDASLTTTAAMQAAGDALLSLFKNDEIRMTPFASVDYKLVPGANAPINTGAPLNINVTVQVQSVTVTRFGMPGTDDHNGTVHFVYPLRTVEAGSTRYTLQDLLRQVRLN